MYATIRHIDLRSPDLRLNCRLNWWLFCHESLIIATAFWCGIDQIQIAKKKIIAVATGEFSKYIRPVLDLVFIRLVFIGGQSWLLSVDMSLQFLSLLIVRSHLRSTVEPSHLDRLTNRVVFWLGLVF
jgi:hypothetical protein